MVGTPEGVTTFEERHVLGLFTHEEYAAAMAAANLQVDHDPSGPFGRGMYIGRRSSP
jgi:dTDP-3-amino-3,6-dideoxy-alpha-D-glucopyranose N,N-dimethyltransferase/dTDP-3-amino-3,4,6-trideoxy-alpha-D-glucopyranose N,N-dimethyltransferase